MNQKAGLFFISLSSQRIFLILEKNKWTVPTFSRNKTLLEDASELFNKYSSGKIIPIELYVSNDKGFEYGTYVCIVEKEFFGSKNETISWCNLNKLPGNLHTGLKNTLNNTQIKTKIETIMELQNVTKN